ncbi:MAG TPA: hypothetical protein VN960_05520 [Gaiellaceae bacterium]|nr:hypothetical protein [Gaiellaceae bacterium]
MLNRLLVVEAVTDEGLPEERQGEERAEKRESEFSRTNRISVVGQADDPEVGQHTDGETR